VAVNFVGELFFLGALFGLSPLTGSEGPVRITGPVLEYRKVPAPMEFLGLRLQGLLDLALDKLSLPFTHPRIFIKSPLNDAQVDHNVTITRDPGIYFLAEVHITGPPAELIAKYQYRDNELLLEFFGYMQDCALAGFSSLAQSVGGDDLEGNLPAEIQQPQGLRLTEFGAAVNVTTMEIGHVMAGVGMDTHWVLLEDKLVVEGIGLNCRISNPFNGQLRALGFAISGEIAIGEDVPLIVYADFPPYRFGGGLPAGQTIPVGKLLTAFFDKPPHLPPMTITDLIFDAQPEAKRFAMDCAITEVFSFPVGATQCALGKVQFAINYDPSAGATGAFSAEMTIAEAATILAGELTDTLTLAGSLRNLNLQRFFTLVTGGETLPEEVPEIMFETLTLSVAPTTGDFRMFGEVDITWDELLPQGNGHALSTKVQFNLSRDVASDTGSKIGVINAT
jgi:hypothetical protein